MNDLLTYIDRIQEATDNAEINVLESLIETYDKSIMILEECEDIEPYADILVFQEGAGWDKFKEDTKAPILGKKGEGFFKRLLMIVPRLIQKLIALIKKIFKKSDSEDKRITKEMKELKANEKTSFRRYKMADEDVDKVMTKLKKRREKNMTNKQVEKAVEESVPDDKPLGELMFTIHDDFVFKTNEFGDVIENLKFTDFDGLRISEDIRVKAAAEIDPSILVNFQNNAIKCRDEILARKAKIKNRIPNDISVTYSREEKGGSNYIVLSYSEIVGKLEKLNKMILDSRHEMREGFHESYNKSISMIKSRMEVINKGADEELKKAQEQGLPAITAYNKYNTEHPGEIQFFAALQTICSGDFAYVFDEFIAAYIILWDKYYWAVKNAIDNAKKEMNCNG